MNKRILTTLVAVTAAGGLALGAASLANADESTPTPTATSTADPNANSGSGMGNGNTDPSKPMRSDEQLLTGGTAAKVTAAAKAEEPDATIERVETDSDGVYEAHMVRSDGTHVTVQVDKDFKITNVDEMGQGNPGRPHGDPGGSNDSDSSSGTGGSESSTSSATMTS